MRKLYSLLLSALSLVIAVQVTAQDIHFSQFYASPLTLNPASAGVIEGDYRVAAIYRNQWATVTTPYVTYGGSFDMRLLKKKLKRDVFAVGAVITNDKSGNSKLGDLAISATAAFHKALGAKNKHYLGVGLQLGYVQRSLDYASLTFPAQHQNGIFDNNLPNGENIGKNKIGYFDMAAGLEWNGQLHDRVGMFAGGSFFHLTNPKESFLNQNARLAPRFVVHGGLRIKVTPRFYITPNYILMFQDKNREINFGTGLEYAIGNGSKRTIVGAGGWYRTGDAGIVSASVEYWKIRLGLAYDVTTSGLQAVPKSQGSFEIALVYTGLFPNNNIGPVMVPCPRM